MTGGKGSPSRLKTGNGAVDDASINKCYTDKKQVELLAKIFRRSSATARRVTSNSAAAVTSTPAATSRTLAPSSTANRRREEVFVDLRRPPPDRTLRRQLGRGHGVRRPAVLRPHPSGCATTNVFRTPKAATELLKALDGDARKVAVMPGKWKEEHSDVKVPKRATRCPASPSPRWTRIRRP